MIQTRTLGPHLKRRSRRRVFASALRSNNAQGQNAFLSSPGISPQPKMTIKIRVEQAKQCRKKLQQKLPELQAFNVKT